MKRPQFISIKPFNNKVFYNDGLFDDRNHPERKPFKSLKVFLKTKNIFINTIDIKTNSKIEIYIDLPYPYEIVRWCKIFFGKKEKILFCWEPPIVNPFNYMKILYIFFSKVYAWNDKILSQEKHIKKFYFPNPDPELLSAVPFEKKKLLTLINSYLLPILPFKILSLNSKELYTERVKAIDYFDKKLPLEFDLFGKGWNSPSRFSLIQKIFRNYKRFSRYKGGVEIRNKISILSNYKFCICFENSSVAGYISEKIFDCFKANCVPIYLGAPNVDDYIPEDCFVDFRKFKSYDELTAFLLSIDRKRYEKYLMKIQAFLSDPKTKKKWFESAFHKTFFKSIS